MKMTSLAIATLTAVLGLGMLAAPSAQAAGDRDDRRGHHGWDDRGRGHDRHRNRGHDRRDERRERREWRDDRRHYSAGYREGYRDARHNDRRHYAPPRVVYRGHPPHGWARGHDYRRGYRGPVYVVNDYNRYDLRHPPRGHHWIRDDRGNYLLVAIATGIIADWLLRN